MVLSPEAFDALVEKAELVDNLALVDQGLAAADLVLQRLEKHPSLLQLADHRVLLPRIAPGTEEVVDLGELLRHLAAGVVLERLGDQLAVGWSVVLHPFGDYITGTPETT